MSANLSRELTITMTKLDSQERSENTVLKNNDYGTLKVPFKTF